MPEKRSYTDVLISLETDIAAIKTHQEYANNHLGNIDSHLNRQNETLLSHTKTITKNGTWIAAFKYLIGVILTTLAVIATHLFGVW